MVQGYYGLDEAAQILGMSPEKVSQMAQRREIRAFSDRGTWRFRTQDVEEMARRLGKGSSPELQLGEAAPKAPDAPTAGEGSVFDFPLNPVGDQVEIGQEVLETPGGSQKSRSRSGHTPAPPPQKGSDSDVRLVLDSSEAEFRVVGDSKVKPDQPQAPAKPSSKRKTGLTPGGPSSPKGGPLSPKPKPGSDSDVHLVLDSSDADFRLVSDSDVKVDEPPAGSKSSTKRKSPAPEAPSSKTGSKKKGGLPSSARLDAGVRLVPLDEAGDSHVPVSQEPPRSATDSDIRLELEGPNPAVPKPGPGVFDPTASSTMEIDLDAELRKAEEAARAKKPRSKVKPKTKTTPPAAGGVTSPFELSAEDRQAASDSSAEAHPSSSDFDLTPAAEQPTEAGSLFDAAADEEVALGDLTGTGPSGINLHSPDDSGINLEKSAAGGDQVEFELSLDAESTPQPSPASSDADSESDFELTLDEGGELAPLEEEAPAPAEGAGGEKDIFETDFEMPALDEESSSEAVALDDADTDLESSDFDLSLSDEESGSQVVALEEGEEADEEAATMAGEAPAEEEVAPAEEEPEEVDELLGEDLPDELEEKEEAAEPRARRAAVAAVAAAPANWGVLPAILMVPCVLVMFVLAMMSFELLHGMWGYKQPYKPTGFIVEPLCDLFGQPLPEK
jgi:excisionase family DNA binding protein